MPLSSADSAQAAARPHLSSLAVELTAHCNLRCGHCYNDFRADDGASLASADGDRVLARVRKLLDAVEIARVTVTGGEPFSTKLLWPLLELLGARGVPAQIISNGTLIDDRVAERLAPLGLGFVQISLDGADRQAHEAHAGQGSFDLTLQGIRTLQAHGVRVVGCTVVTRPNAASVGAILALWHELGVDEVALSRFSPAGYAVAQAARLLPALADLEQAFAAAAAHARAHGTRISCTMPVPPCMLDAASFAPLRFGHCAIGTRMQELALGPDGKLRNCTLHRSALGGVTDILDDGVDIAALLAHADLRDYQLALPAFCQGCLHAASCGGGCGAAAEWMLGRAGKRRLPDPLLWQHIDDAFGARLERERQEQLAEGDELRQPKRRLGLVP
jgi:radical SAM protein with 4Fe4S-binding SPASM domain